MQPKFICVLMLVGMLLGCNSTPYSPSTYSPSSPSTTTVPTVNEAEAEQRRAEEEQRRAEEDQRRAEEDQRRARRDSIHSELSRLDQKYNDLSSRIVAKEENISLLRTRLLAAEGDVKTFEGQVQSYISDNIVAAGCLEAADVSLDEGNQYEQDVQDGATVVVVTCTVMLLDKQFRDQVINVADQLNQADIRTDNLNRQVIGIRTEIDEQLAALELEKTALGDVDRTRQTREYELEELDSL